MAKKWPCENCGGAGMVVKLVDHKFKMVYCPKCNPGKQDAFETLLKLNESLANSIKESVQWKERALKAEAELAKYKKGLQMACNIYAGNIDYWLQQAGQALQKEAADDRT